MSDYSELKRMAEAAQNSCIETGQRWPEADDWFEPDLISEEMDFLKGASPSVVLALIAENDRLASAYVAAGEREHALRTEVEELRKDAERYRWLKVQKNHVCKDFNDSGLPALGVMVSILGYEWIGLSENIDAAMGKGEQS